MNELKYPQKSITQQKWEKEQFRFKDGIFFGDGRVTIFSGDIVKREFTIINIDTLINKKPDSLARIGTKVEQIREKHDIRVCAGGGSWEGEGFVAVCQLSNEQLLWLIHLSDYEEFTEIEIRDNEIFAVSEEYPMHHEWIIPINDPENIRKVS